MTLMKIKKYWICIKIYYYKKKILIHIKYLKNYVSGHIFPISNAYVFIIR